MAVLYTQHFVQFFDDNGDPLNGGLLYSYEAGTTTPKDTYTTAAGSVANANPLVLDSAGRGVLFLSGAYKFTLKTSAGVTVRTTDNVTAFATSGVNNITGDFTAADVAAADSFVFSDATDSNTTRRDTVQGILDLVPVDLAAKADTVIVAGDKITFYDASDSNLPKTDTVQGIIDLVTIPYVKSEIGITSAVATSTTTLPADDTIPQITEGVEVITVSITPSNASNRLMIDALVTFAVSANGTMTIALFQDATANALAASAMYIGTVNVATQVRLTHEMAAGTTSATTFRIRIGNSAAGTTTINGASAARLYGGVSVSQIKVTEVTT